MDIHLKQCKKQFEIEQSKLPPGQRRYLPTVPENFGDKRIGELKGYDLEKYNDEAFKNYNEKALVPCKN